MLHLRSCHQPQLPVSESSDRTCEKIGGPCHQNGLNRTWLLPNTISGSRFLWIRRSRPKMHATIFDNSSSRKTNLLTPDQAPNINKIHSCSMLQMQSPDFLIKRVDREEICKCRSPGFVLKVVLEQRLCDGRQQSLGGPCRERMTAVDKLQHVMRERITSHSDVSDSNTSGWW